MNGQTARRKLRRLLRGSLPPGLAIIAAVAIAYGNTLSNSFHYDDEHSIVGNPHVRSLENIPSFFTDPQTFSRNPGSEMYRPLLLTTYALNYASNEFLGLEGYDVRGFHAVNVAVHGAASFLLMLLLITWGMERRRAFVAATIFALNPLCTEPVNYISSRSESLAVLFLFASLFSYANSYQQDVRLRRQSSALSLFFFACGLLMKSIVAVLPLLLAVQEWFYCARRPLSDWKAYLRVIARNHWPYWCVVLAYFATTERLIREALDQPVRSLGSQLSTQLKAVVYYLKLLAVPRPLSIEHQFQEGTSAVEPAVLLPLLLILSMILVARPWLRLGGRRSVWGAWMILILLPTALVSLNVLVSERRLYFSVAAFSGFVMWLLTHRIAPWPKLYRGIVVCVIVGLLGSFTMDRNRVWATERELWLDARANAPEMVRPHLRIGTIYRASGEPSAAREAFETALQIDPNNASAYNNLGNISSDEGRLGEAVDYYMEALRLLPSYADAMINLATVLGRQGRLVEARDLLSQAIPLAPARFEAYNNLGTIYLRMKQFAQAEVVLRKGLGLEPVAGAYRNLGGALEGQKNYEGARDAYQLAVLTDPEYAKGYYDLARLSERLDEYGLALKSYRQFLVYWRGKDETADSVRAKLNRLERSAGGDPVERE